MHFALNGVGKRIWDSLATAKSEEQLARSVMSEFDAPAAEVGPDVRDFLRKLIREDLVEQYEG
jgi:hypothetical protein